MTLLDNVKRLYPGVYLDATITSTLIEDDKNDWYRIDYPHFEANTPAGIFYGLIDWVQHGNNVMCKTLCKERGLHVDCGRKYLSKAWFLDMLDEMARQSLNVLQIHFSENEGFRLEIPNFGYLASQEHLSLEELNEIVTHAQALYIEIIPSFDTPGHLGHILSHRPQYRLPGSKTALDITSKEARSYIHTLYDAIIKVFPNSTKLHMGGDEFIPFDEYDKYPSLTNYAQKTWGPHAKGSDVYYDYLKETLEYLQTYGLDVRVWNDGLYRVNQKETDALPNNSAITYWTSWNENMAPVSVFKEKGHRLINFMDSHLYFVLGEKAGYTYPDASKIETSFQVNHFPLRHHLASDTRTQSLELEDPLFLGSYLSIWSDDPDALDETQVSLMIRPLMNAFSKQCWRVDKI